jgi:hypothetical protein
VSRKRKNPGLLELILKQTTIETTSMTAISRLNLGNPVCGEVQLATLLSSTPSPDLVGLENR